MKFVVRETGSFESFDGSSIYYETRGQGSPMIFCYGLGCLFNHWSKQIYFFSKNHETLVWDYRGHHKSPIPQDKATLTVDALAQDLIALCHHKGYPSVVCVGHSFGVLVLLRAYELKKELFKKFIFINGLYQNPFEQWVSALHLLEGINKLKLIYNQAPSFFNFLWKKGVTHPLMIPISGLVGGFNLSRVSLKDIEIYTRGASSIDFRVFVSFFEEMIASQWGPKLEEMQIPTLVLGGTKDSLTPSFQQKIMGEKIPHAQSHIFKEGSHCIQLDFPDEVNKKIENFL